MGIGVLGPVLVDGSGPVSPRDRVLLSVLVVRRGEVVPADQLADALWGEDVPESWRKIVQGAVVRLRKVLGPTAIETTTGGYRLVAGEDDVDAWRFEQLVQRAANLAEMGEHDRASDLLQRAHTLWRGEPFADLSGWAAGQAEAARLMELRRSAEESEIAARLALGEHRDVVAASAALCTEEPLREERWTLLATALYRSGRQGEALRALHDARRVLAEQLGVDPGAPLVELEQAILRQDPVLDAPHPSQPGGARDECPYQGLEAYDEAQANEFFGRDTETAECRRRLATTRFLAVVGPSGSGKSSLVRAGLVAALRAEGRTAVVCVPGADPPGALSAALASARPDAVLVVDQGEELFTVCSDAARRERFAVALAEQASERPVVMTLRADHIGDLVAFPVLSRLVEGGLYLLGPMGEADLRAAIEGPARDAGLRLEAGLVDLLVRDVLGQPGALPLLSHALVETWARREGRVMTVAAYRETGGVQGAVARTAEQLYESLSGDQRVDARALFLRLVSIERDGQAVRHRLHRSMLAGDQDEIAGTLVRARLLTAGDGSLEIAHEALAEAWPRLQDWLEEDRDGQRVLTHLSAAAQDWSARGNDPADLYRGHRLQAANEWVARTGFELSPVERAFLHASDAARAAEVDELAARHQAQEETNRRLSRRLRAVAVLLVVALLATGFAFVQVRRADDERDRARQASRASALQSAMSQSLGLRASQRDVAALLAAETYRMQPSPATESALFSTFTGSPDFIGYLRAPRAFWTGAMDAGGHVIAGADEDAEVHVFDADRMQPLRTIPSPGPDRKYGVVALTPDGTTVAVGSSFGADGPLERGALSVYETSTGRARFPEVTFDFPVGDVAVSPDARFVSVSGGRAGHAEVYDLRTGIRTASIPPAPPGEGPNNVSTAAVAFVSPNRLAVGSEVGLIRIMDPATGAVVTSIDATAGYAESRLFPSPDGRTIVASGVAGTTVIDVATGAPRWSSRNGIDCNRVVPDFTRGLVLCSDPYGRVGTIDLATGVATPRHFDFHDGFASALVVSADGRTLAVVGGDVGSVGVWRLDGSGLIQRKVGADSDSAIGYNPSGGPALLVADWAAEPHTFRAADPRRGTSVDIVGGHNATWSTYPGEAVALFEDGVGAGYDVVRGRRIPGSDVQVDFLPAMPLPDRYRNRLMLFDAEGHVRTFDNGRSVPPSMNLPGGRRDPTSGAITPDGRYMLVTSDQHGLETFTVPGAKRVASRPDLVNVAVSSRGVAAATGQDGHVALYDPRTLQPLGVLPAAPGSAMSLFFSRDGRRLMVNAWDGTVRIVDVASRTTIGDPIRKSTRQDGFANSEQLMRADARELAVDIDDGIAVWNLSPRAWTRAVCKVAGRNLTRAEWKQYLAPLGPYHRTCVTAS